jgi:hypothetical protein
VDPVSRVDLGCGQIRDDIDSMQQMAGEFLEILDFADAIHFGNDPVEHAFDLYRTCLPLKKVR